MRPAFCLAALLSPDLTLYPTPFNKPMAPRQKILILDDEQEILEIYKEILARLPSQPDIRTATNGHDAVAMLESEQFSLLLIDLNMPQMDGFQVLSIIHRRFPTLRTAVMTGACDDDLRARAYRIGVDLYMEKPKTGREIIFFVDCIESLLEKESKGGFRGVQSKTLLDIIQLECLTKNTCVLKITCAVGEGRVWIQSGEIVDAVLDDRSGKGAMLEMLSWKAGNFEVLPYGLPRPRSIHVDYESLLMESAHVLDQTDGNAAEQAPETLLASFSRFSGVQFAMAVELTDSEKCVHWGCDEPEALAAWVQKTTEAFKGLGSKLQAGELLGIESLGQQQHLSIISGDQEALAIGFTRALGISQIRDTLKQIEAKWAF